jgi:hypothetical protein
MKAPENAVVGVRAPHEVPWHAMGDDGQILQELDSSMQGLSTAEAERRLQM